MSNIFSILSELAADNSRLAKEAILKREINNELLKQVIVAALDPYINYYQKKIPDYKAGKCVPGISLSDALEYLNDLSSRKITGTKAINQLGWILQNCSDKNAQVIERVIARDLKCGVSESTVNKIWPGLVPTFDVMTCHKDISHIVYPAYGQVKMDGARCHLYFDGTEAVAVAFARSGKKFNLHNTFDAAASYFMKDGETIDGELLFIDKNGKILDRKTSNGLANKANKGTLSTEEASRGIFVAWDIVDFTSKIKYKDRFEELSTRLTTTTGIKDKIRLVESIIVKDEEAAVEFFEEQLAKGEEGAILKNFDGVWEPKRSKNQGKMKAEEEADLVVVGIKPGKGKYAGAVGSLECETSEGKVNVHVSGMSEDIRFADINWIGKIVTVRYNTLIKSKNSDVYKLFLPRMIEVRFDKTKANSFEELK